MTGRTVHVAFAYCTDADACPDSPHVAGHLLSVHASRTSALAALDCPLKHDSDLDPRPNYRDYGHRDRHAFYAANKAWSRANCDRHTVIGQEIQ